MRRMAVTSRRSATSCAGEREGAGARALAGRCRRSDALACCELLATATRGWGSSTLLPPELGERVDLAGDIEWRIEGGVRYQAPGLLGQILFDAGIRRPTQPFSGSGTFQINQPASSEPTEVESSGDRPETNPDPGRASNPDP